VIVNNAAYGTIRMHQNRTYPGREFATSLVNPDFVAYARAFGAHAELVTETSQTSGTSGTSEASAFRDAFRRALAANRPAVVEIRLPA
jgi:acetolactate synthase-1/2/3 large subunit